MSPLKRILLVEDDPNDIELMLKALSQQNLDKDVAVAHDGEEALKYLKKEVPLATSPNSYPLVVILDVKMPKIGGLEVLHQMRSDPSLKHIPTVILTSSREERDLVQGYELGTNAYVVKPVNFNDYIRIVQHVGHFWTTVNEPPKCCLSKT